MGAIRYIFNHLNTYLRYTVASVGVVLSFASVEIFTFLEQPRPEHFVIPTLLGITFGMLISTIVIMRAETAQQRQTYRAIADLAQEFSYVRRDDGYYDYVSPSCLHVTGYPPEDFQQRRHFMESLLVPEDRVRWDGHIHRAQPDGRPESLVVRIRHHNGSERWIEHICCGLDRR